jgi:RsiW-degrading membrane proteinase PrsW (M82 family)
MSIFQSRWLLSLVTGLILIGVLVYAVSVTKSAMLFPSILLLSAALGPVTFIFYLGDQKSEISRSVPISSLLILFVVSGVAGIAAGAIGDSKFVNLAAPLTILYVGLIEEAAKLIIPLALFALGVWSSRSAGILIGITSAAAFAIFESMGYGFREFILALNNTADINQAVAAVINVNLIRALTTPFGHLAWTGFVCGALWSYRASHGKLNFVYAFGVFLIAAALHSFFDFSLIFSKESGGLSLILLPIVAAISFWLVIKQVKLIDSPEEDGVDWDTY